MPLHEWLKDDREPPRFTETPGGTVSSEPSPANERATPELDDLVDQLLQEVNGELNTYLYEPGSFTPLAKFTPTRDLSVVADHLGTPAALYDGAGRKVWENRMDIYGRPLWTDGLAADMWFRYPGQYEDNETGLSYNRFRYYDAGVGCYISRDPVGLAGGNPTLYGYVGDVNSMTDVFGLKECFACEKARNFAEDIITKFGGRKVKEGHYQMPSRKSARQAASEIAGNLGNNPTKVTKADFRGGPRSWRNNQSKIGQYSQNKKSGWRDDILGHDFGGGDKIGSHVNAWNESKGVFDNLHLLY